MTETYFAEEGFGDWMRQEVEPFLKKIGQYGYFQSEDGRSIYYTRYHLVQSQKCVVISHGFCEFAEKYNEVIYYFLRAGYSVYIMEHRGHGYSERETADIEKVYVKDYQLYVKDFVHFVWSIVVPMEEHRILFGHSMGGAVAALVLEQYPNLFEAAILSSPMCRMLTGKYPEAVAVLTAGIQCMVGNGTKYAAGQGGFREEPEFEKSSCQSEARYEYIFEKRLADEHYHTYGGSYAWVRAGIYATHRLMKRRNLKKITIPVLLFAAGHDHMVDNSAIGQFVERTKQTELVFAPDAKHEIFNANYRTRRKYYDEIFSFLIKEEGANLVKE